MKTRLFPFWLRMITVLTMLVVALSFAGTAHAASCTVTSDLDDGTAGTLRALLADTSCDTINFAGDATIHLASELSLTRNVTIDGGTNQIVISGDTNDDGTPNVRILTVGSGVTVALQNLTVTEGSNQYGGGLYNDGTLTVAHSTFIGNHAGVSGGGIRNQGTLTLTDSTFSSNSAGAEGGAIFNSYGTVTVGKSTFSQNSASSTTSWDGGGAINNYYGTLMVTDSAFSDNSAVNTGGGINSSSGSVTVTNSIFSGNSAPKCGGIYHNGGVLTVSGSSFPDNSASQIGGAICNYYGPLAVTGTIFSGNRTAKGGAIYAYMTPTTVTNSTFSDNTATYQGAGIYAYGNEADVTVTNSTFSGQHGHTLYSYAARIISRNSVLVTEAGNNCGATVTAPGLGTIGGSNSLVNDWSCGGSFINSSSILLGPLGDYGGGSKTLPLLPGSAAIDAGDSAYCPTTDQRGVARVGACDIGAFESQGFTLGSLTGTPQGTGVSSGFATPLGLTVLANASGEPVAGGRVTFTAPAEGPSATITSSPATIAADGTVSVTAQANAVVGSYNVAASAAGASSVDFALMNMPTAIMVLNANDSGPGSLRQALLDIAPDGTITFQGDTAIYLNSTLEISRSMTIDGGTNTVVLSGDTNGDGTPNVRVLSVGSGVAATLQNLTVTDGWAITGAGIYNLGTLALTNVALSGNDAANIGGSIANGGGTVTLNNSSISDSHAGLYGGGISSSLGAVTLNNSTISGSGAQLYGGAVFGTRATLTVTDSTFAGNSSFLGGGVANDLGTLEIRGSTFLNNSAVSRGSTNSRGGAIMSFGGWSAGDAPGLLTVTNSTFSGNSAIEGGAIFRAANNSGGTTAGTLTGSTFSGNSATRGGAVESLGIGLVLEVTNSTFSGNSAASGAGLYNDSGDLTVTNSTFSGQQGPALQNGVGGAYGVATTTSRNSLLVKGTGDNCTGTIGGSNNLADDGSCGSGFANSSTILLGTLGEYGGSTQTIPLLPGSAAIHAANAAYCPAADQRGVSRGTTCDIGAFQSQGFTFSDLTGTPQEAAFGTPFAAPLGLRVTANGSGEPVAGGQVTFTPPSSGASATITGSPATIGADGALSVTATANALVGTYTVTASSAGATSVDFSLNNLCTSSNITVQNANDSGDGSLRQAIEQVCTGGTISFAGDTTIYLASPLTIGRNVTIDGGANTVVLSGDTNNDGNMNPRGYVQVLAVGPDVTAAVQNLTVTNGGAVCGLAGCGGVSGGGAVYNNGGTVTLTNVTLSDNFSSREAGGAIYNNGGTVTLTNSMISGSFAPGAGGAIYNNGGTVTLTNSQIAGSFVHYYGGAIYNRAGTLNVTNSTFSANVADADYSGQGGAIYNRDGTAKVTNSTFSGNSGIDGGAIYSNGQLTVTGSTFSGNVAYYDDWGGSGGRGGAIYNSSATSIVTNSTFSGNSATSGAGVHSSGALTMANSLLEKSTGGNCAGAITGSNNLADDGTCGSGSNQSSAILLGPLGDYGGSTQTFPLLPGSPAINGTSSDCPATDQRGVARGMTCDIGAFESQFTLTKLGGDDQVAAPTAAFASPLLVAVTATGNAPVDGGTITFSAPSSGASASLSAIEVTVVGGQVSINATANEYVGQYSVTAGMVKAASLDFSLTNTGDTTTALSASLNPSAYGDEVTFTAVVTIDPPGLGEPRGTVTFYQQLGTGEVLALSEVAGPGYTFTTSSLAGGVHNIYAVYNGDTGTNTSKSNAVAQTVNLAPTITEQPASQTVYEGQPASFGAAAVGYPVPAVQWQVSTDGGTTWSDIADATASTYSFTASLTQNGYQYHAIFTNTVGSATSDAAALTVQPAGADLDLTMATNAQPSDAKITYSIAVTNFGPSAAQTVVLSDPLPAGTAFVSAKATQGTCNAKNKVITCKIGAMDNGGSVTITLVLKRTDFTIEIVNTATVSSATDDPNTDNNSAAATVAIR